MQVNIEPTACQKVTFCEIPLESSKMKNLPTYHITTIKESSRIRYQYYGVDAELVGTIFTSLENGTISDNTNFYNALSIEATVEKLQSKHGTTIFWIFWSLLIGGCLYGFFYLDNKWLE